MSEPNTTHPGLPDYVGPTEGWFTLLHHEGPRVEFSYDVHERITYIKIAKSTSEIDARLRHIVLFPLAQVPESVRRADAEWERADAEWARAYAEWKRADAEWKRADAEWERAYAEWKRAYAEWKRAYAEWKRADAEWKRADAEWKRAYAEWARAQANELDAFIRANVPDCAWDGTKIVF